MQSDTTPQNEVVDRLRSERADHGSTRTLGKENRPKLYKAVQEIQELPNGWAWRLPSDPEILLLVAERPQTWSGCAARLWITMLGLRQTEAPSGCV